MGSEGFCVGVGSRGWVGIDPRSWEPVHFTLWEHAAPTTHGLRYQVLHLSAPGLATEDKGNLTVGRL
jgi:hypothetical protein